MRESRMSRTYAEQSRLREAHAGAVRRGPCMFQGPERRLMRWSSFAETRSTGKGPGLISGDVGLEVHLEHPHGNIM